MNKMNQVTMEDVKDFVQDHIYEIMFGGYLVGMMGIYIWASKKCIAKTKIPSIKDIPFDHLVTGFDTSKQIIQFGLGLPDGSSTRPVSYPPEYVEKIVKELGVYIELCKAAS